MRGRRVIKRFKIFTVKRVIILSVILAILLISVVGRYFSPTMMSYAEKKATFHASFIINNAIRDQVVPNIDTSRVIVLQKRDDGTVTSVGIDVYQVNNILAKMTAQIQEELTDIEKDETNVLNSMEIPIGVIFRNPVLDQMGPKIKVKMNFVGTVHTDIETRLEHYGINNTLIQINVKTTIRMQLIIPFHEKEFTVTTSTPLIMEVIQGEVPRYYYLGGSTANPNPPYDSQNNPEISQSDILPTE